MSENFKQNLGKRIRHLREGAGMKSVVFAEQIGISPQSLSQYESGVHQPSLKVLRLLAHAFGLTIDELIG